MYLYIIVGYIHELFIKELQNLKKSFVSNNKVFVKMTIFKVDGYRLINNRHALKIVAKQLLQYFLIFYSARDKIVI